MDVVDMNMDVNGCAVTLHLRLCLVLGVRGCGSVGDVEITNCGGRWEREGEREKNKREKGGERGKNKRGKRGRESQSAFHGGRDRRRNVHAAS
jgi:hypothetical protein